MFTVLCSPYLTHRARLPITEVPMSFHAWAPARPLEPMSADSGTHIRPLSPSPAQSKPSTPSRPSPTANLGGNLQQSRTNANITVVDGHSNMTGQGSQTSFYAGTDIGRAAMKFDACITTASYSPISYLSVLPARQPNPASVYHGSTYNHWSVKYCQFSRKTGVSGPSFRLYDV